MEGITMLLAQAGVCFGRYLLYLACCIAVLVAARLLLLMPAEVWRKLPHADPHKTWAGTGAMVATAALALLSGCLGLLA